MDDGDGDPGFCSGGIAEEDGVFGRDGFFLENGGEGESSIWGEFEAEIVGEAAHGPAGVDLADTVPGLAVGSLVEEGIDTDGALVVEVGEESGERGEDFFFGGGVDLVRDEAGLPGGEPGGGFGG